MSKSIGVFGAGPGLGHAVARRYAQGGYEVALVARRKAQLDALTDDVSRVGASVHAVAADLAQIDGAPVLAERVRAAVGELDTLYYAPTPESGFVSAVDLTPQRAEAFMPLLFYSFIALVQEFLPHMLEQGEGAILTAQGASTLHGLPDMSGSGPAQAAQRNYLQSLHAEVAGRGVYVGMLYIGALIEQSAFHAHAAQAKAAGTGRDWGPSVDPAYLADLLWNMHHAKAEPEASYPAEASSRVESPQARRTP